VRRTVKEKQRKTRPKERHYLMDWWKHFEMLMHLEKLRLMYYLMGLHFLKQMSFAKGM
jgi:hypothetical protein